MSEMSRRDMIGLAAAGVALAVGAAPAIAADAKKGLEIGLSDLLKPALGFLFPDGIIPKDFSLTIKTPGLEKPIVIKAEDLAKAAAEFRAGAEAFGKDIDLTGIKEVLRTVGGLHARIEDLQKKNHELEPKVEQGKKVPAAAGKYLGLSRSVVHEGGTKFTFMQQIPDQKEPERRSVTYDFATGLFDAGAWGKAAYFPNTASLIFTNGRDPVSVWTKSE